MANKPLLNPLPADLPENWQINQIVAPTGAEVGLAEQYGYNYLMAQLNAAQQAINNINEAFPGLAGLVDGKVPLEQLPVVTPDDALSDTSKNPVQNKVITAALNDKVPITRKVNGKALNGDITLGFNDFSGILPISKGGTDNDTGLVTSGQKNNTTLGYRATAEGIDTTSSARGSHAEGRYSIASSDSSHVEGYQTVASGDSSHAEGSLSVASGENAHAEGKQTTAIGDASHAEGFKSVAKAGFSHAEGDSTAEGPRSHAEGSETVASKESCHSEGYSTIASNFASHVGGKFNKLMTTGGTSSNKVGDVFVIGNGSGSTNKSNAFRVTYAGAVYGLSAFNTSGADYAEYFEWQDTNPEAEDRVGFFVTLQGDKICLAQAGDYLLGIVSANPCIIGNADEDWLGRWEHDDFGRFIQIDVETPVTELRHKEVPLLDENGEPTGEVRFEIEEVPTGEVIHGWDYKQNPDYDSSQQYIERKDRPEWAAVGMLGVLAVRDDGSCQVDGFCQCADSGIATAAEKYIPGNTYRVIARVTENIVKVVFR
ncbi:MAG: hypothetical protein HFJ96_00960 [Peptococcaceae bacterium]|jgi:hypothetical protein|nr:hypothetical protein [Peptococcaceae bacterium]